MKLFLVLMGLYMVATGGLFLFKPAVILGWSQTWLKDKNRRGMAVLTAVIGVLLLWAAPASRAEFLIRVLGWITILKGIYLFAAGREKLDRMMNWWTKLPGPAQKLWAFTAVVLGGAVLLSL